MKKQQVLFSFYLLCLLLHTLAFCIAIIKQLKRLTRSELELEQAQRVSYITIYFLFSTIYQYRNISIFLYLILIIEMLKK